MLLSNVATIKELTKIIVREGSRDEINRDSLTLNTFAMDDVTVIFNRSDNSSDKPKFYGLVFEVLGRDFVITPEFEITVTSEGEDGESESYTISDENFQKSLEKYLDWRLSVLTQFSL